MPKIALLDFDGVILDFPNALKDYLATKCINFKPENIESYNFNGDIGCTKKVVYEAINDAKLYSYLDFYEGAYLALEKLKSFVKVVAYTSVSSADGLSNLRNALISGLDLEGFAYIGGHNKKIEAISDYDNADVDAVFEDCLETLEAWCSKPNVKLFLIKQTYNCKTDENKSSPLWDRVVICENFVDAVDKYIATLA